MSLARKSSNQPATKISYLEKKNLHEMLIVKSVRLHMQTALQRQPFTRVAPPCLFNLSHQTTVYQSM